VEFWIKSLAAVQGYNVVITLHPSQNMEDLSYIEQWGVMISKEKTSSLIPLCDIYVTDGLSSTIPWALACGKPVIEYDAFRWGLSSFEGPGGSLRVSERAEFQSTLHALTSDFAFYARILNQQLESARQWGNLDGKSAERILQLFEILIVKYQNNRGKGKFVRCKDK
jgi:hypothetical protein